MNQRLDLKIIQRIFQWRGKANFYRNQHGLAHTKRMKVKLQLQGCLNSVCWGWGKCFSFSTAHPSAHTQKNHYEVLNVNRTASAVEIREAFLKLSKECHPDINKNKNDPGENHRKFVVLNEAYSVLSKPKSRQDYDLTLQVHKHLRQHSNHSAYRSYSYGHQANNPYYHHNSHVEWDGMSSSPHANDEFRSGKRLHRKIFNFYSLTAFFTVGFVALILSFEDLIVPDQGKIVPKKIISKHDFIMTSSDQGKTVSYYAVPDSINPESFKVVVLNKETDGESSDCELEELNINSI